MLRAGSKSFAQAAQIFDPETREAVTLLYAWCRHCDDQVDGERLGHDPHSVSRAERRARLERLQDRTARALAGQADDDPVFQAFARVSARYAIPDRYALELLEGFAMDVDGRRCANLEETLLYCYHVAGTVGLMMAHVMGARDERSLERAADLGIGLQLTNIARDVVEDARQGRVYLPQDWLAAAGLREEDLVLPEHRPAVARLVSRLLDEAQAFYASGDKGLCRLPLRSAWAVAVARGVYADIGREVRARGPRAWDRRVIVSRPRKLLWTLIGLSHALTARALRTLIARSPRAPLWKREPSLD
jgi:phytoene synthase